MIHECTYELNYNGSIFLIKPEEAPPENAKLRALWINQWENVWEKESDMPRLIEATSKRFTNYVLDFTYTIENGTSNGFSEIYTKSLKSENIWVQPTQRDYYTSIEKYKDGNYPLTKALINIKSIYLEKLYSEHVFDEDVYKIMTEKGDNIGDGSFDNPRRIHYTMCTNLDTYDLRGNDNNRILYVGGRKIRDSISGETSIPFKLLKKEMLVELNTYLLVDEE